jgi:hypothetical protein
MAINQGDVRRVSVAFTNILGAAADPTAVYLYVKKPGLGYTTLTYGVDAAIVKPSTGNYYADLDLDTVGQWLFEWAGTGAVTANEGGQFRVSARVVRG